MRTRLMSPLHCALGTMMAALCLATPVRAQPQQPSAAGIYSCTTADGRRLTSDRPIAECASREQRILNADGSFRSTLPPFLSPEERAAQEQRERKAAAERSAQNDAVRRDRTLMQRFPNEVAHQRARVSALDDANNAMHASERRIKDLAKERKPLMDEAEFYKGRPLPPKLKQSLDANDASVDATRQLIENQRGELIRINSRFDAELARLKKLWAGAAPGSLGALTMPTDATSGR
jgi:chromosome segregation ATPase